MIKSDVKRHLSNATVEQLINALDEDQVIVYPTDTLYGLGVNACSKSAVAKLYKMKSRKGTAVSVLLGSVTQLLELAEGIDDQARRLINKFLPGPLTVICKSEYPFAKQLYSAEGTIGFRVPGDEISTQLPTLFGEPITTTSVNPAGQSPATSFPEVKAYFKDEVSLMLNVGKLEGSLGSTVIDLSTTPFKILREGEIPRQVIEDFIN